jgi:hypothetical protein
MKMKSSMMMMSAFTLVTGAGIAQGAGATSPTTLQPDVRPVQQIGHIYFNVASGERIVSLPSATQGADAGNPGSGPIWSTLIQNACADFGYTTEYFFGVDDATGTTSLSTGVTLLDYGDIPTDTVVDCFQVNWVVAHPDTDTDLDSIGDGVEELAGQWMVWDIDNGRAVNQCSRLPLVDVLFFNLPGNIADPGFLSGYTLDVDLVAGFTGTDLSFEICDTDGDCQTAAFCNSSVFDSASGVMLPVGLCDNDFDGLPDSDLDNDGLADFSWTVRFYQPGTGNDFDSDGDSGVAAPSSADTIGVSFGFPEGTATDNGDGTFTYIIDSMADPAGTGEEDRFAFYNPPTLGGDITYNGGYWFGGFACTGGLVDTGGTGYTPPAMFQFELYGPDSSICCCADINGDGVLNFFDVSAFIQDYNAGGDYNGDGMTNFFDVSAFVQDFNAGCP